MCTPRTTYSEGPISAGYEGVDEESGKEKQSESESEEGSIEENEYGMQGPRCVCGAWIEGL